MVLQHNVISRKVNSAIDLSKKLLRRWWLGHRNNGYMLKKVEPTFSNIIAIKKMEELISTGGLWERPQPYRSRCSFEREFLSSSDLVDWLDQFVYEHQIGEYLGVDRPYLRCIQYWHDQPLANQFSPTETQYYHVDGDADGNVKIFLLLHETSLNNGPTQAINPRSLNVISILKSPIRKKVFGRIADDDLNGLTFEVDIVSHVGARGSVLLADTSSIYHRGLSPQDERKIILIQFTDHNIHVSMDDTLSCSIAKETKYFALYPH
jgi:hypothetical protein